MSSEQGIQPVQVSTPEGWRSHRRRPRLVNKLHRRTFWQCRYAQRRPIRAKDFARPPEDSRLLGVLL